MSGDQLDLDAIERLADRIAETHGDFNVHALGVLLGRDVPDLVAEVRSLRGENHRLATLLGRRMTGPEIGAAIAHGIESGAIEIPPEGSPMLSSDEVARAIGLDIV